ncbi:MAG: AMP-binding protein [Clostridiales Family XIII bacterium]|nr:AMP-binding protein [Clostridiales Family XIII bacterium]
MKSGSLTSCLERTAAAMPGKVMFIDEYGSITFGDFVEKARRLGRALRKYIDEGGDGVAVIVDKSIRAPLVYAAVMYAGSFYLPIDSTLPTARKKQLIGIASTPLLLVAARGQDADELGFTGMTLAYDDLEALASGPAGNADDGDGRDAASQAALSDTGAPEGGDPLCVIFTSGSTGTPKGVTLSHSAVLRYLEDFARIVGLGPEDRLAGQSPPDYVAALRDLYFPFICGASTCLAPKRLFSFPTGLFEYLNEHRATALFWVAPVLSYCAEFKVFDAVGLDTVNKVVFTGSVLPSAHLRYWQNHLPGAMFMNHYGPTEATATVSYYIVSHAVAESEDLPIGVPLPAVGVELLGEDALPVAEGEIGEIYVRGGGLAIGYWRDADLTARSFPVLTVGGRAAERYFRTGDMGRLLPDGNLAFHGRKDLLIKLMGHRVELAEIERAAARLDGVTEAICVYDPERTLLTLFYTGPATDGNLAKYLRMNLPDFMIPRRFHGLGEIPRLPGGKPDRRHLRDLAIDLAS